MSAPNANFTNSCVLQILLPIVYIDYLNWVKEGCNQAERPTLFRYNLVFKFIYTISYLSGMGLQWLDNLGRNSDLANRAWCIQALWHYWYCIICIVTMGHVHRGTELALKKPTVEDVAGPVLGYKVDDCKVTVSSVDTSA